MRSCADHGHHKDSARARDESQTEKSGARHGALRVVEETVDAGVGKLSGVVWEKEVAEEPA